MRRSAAILTSIVSAFFLSALLVVALFARDAGRGWVYDYMRSGHSTLFRGYVQYADGTPAANHVLRVVVLGKRTAVIRGATDINGSFEMRVPTEKRFKFGVFCEKCDPPKYVWYIRTNPGIPAGTTIYEKEW